MMMKTGIVKVIFVALGLLKIYVVALDRNMDCLITGSGYERCSNVFSSPKREAPSIACCEVFRNDEITCHCPDPISKVTPHVFQTHIGRHAVAVKPKLAIRLAKMCHTTLLYSC